MPVPNGLILFSLMAIISLLSVDGDVKILNADKYLPTRD
jgi:hypothetical protein